MVLSMAQLHTSADTSINKDKLPAIYGKARKHGYLKTGIEVLDYGCGKFPQLAQKYLKDIGAWHIGYDKYNLSNNDNAKAFLYGINTGYDLVLCSNVLNVIDDDAEMKNVIKNCMDLTRGNAIFTVYEKDKSGNGQETKPDCYQRNQPIVFYQNVIEAMGYNVERVDGMLVVSK